jgi:HdeA/HdeB family
MNLTCRTAMIVLVAGLSVPLALRAQDSKDRTVDQYKCRDVIRESGPNRDIAIAFLHGFLLGKSGAGGFNLDTLHNQTESFVERCLSNPDEKAVEAMTAVKR